VSKKNHKMLKKNENPSSFEFTKKKHAEKNKKELT
jgi:ribosomal protein L24E